MVTIKQIATATGVSSSTVSRVLNSDMTLSVSDNTRQKVIDTAKQLNYIKKAKKNEKQKAIHICVLTVFSESREARDTYWRQIYMGIEKAAYQSGVLIDEIIRIDQGVDAMLLGSFDAVIILGNISEEAITKIREINHNIVLVDSTVHYNDVTAVNPELSQMTYRILDELYGNGRRHIGFIGGDNDVLELDGTSKSKINDPRFDSYHEWMSLKQLQPQSFIGDWRPETGSQGTVKLLADGNIIDALVVASDPIAIGAISILKNYGLEPGKDIDIVSFDNLDIVAYIIPPLTTVELSPLALGKTALAQAIELSSAEHDWTNWTTIPSSLKYRETFKAK